MKSNLKYIGTLNEKKPCVIFIPGGMATPPDVFYGIDEMIPWNSIIIEWCKSPGPWDVLELGNRLADFIKEHQLNKVIVAGYSAGGVIAQQAAIRDEEKRIAGLLLSNTGPCAIGHGDPDLPGKILKQWFSMELFEPFMKRCFAFPIAPKLRERMIAYAKTVDKEVVYQSSKTVREHDIRSQLGQITCPVTIAHGMLDKTRTMQHVDMLREGIPQAEFIPLHGGHTIMIEDRAGWVKALNQLIEKVEKKAD